MEGFEPGSVRSEITHRTFNPIEAKTSKTLVESIKLKALVLGSIFSSLRRNNIRLLAKRTFWKTPLVL